MIMQHSMMTDDVAYAYEAVVRDSGSGLTASEGRRCYISVKMNGSMLDVHHLNRENPNQIANDLKKKKKARSSTV